MRPFPRCLTIGMFLLESDQRNLSKAYLLGIWGDAMKLLRRRFLRPAICAAAITVSAILTSPLGQSAWAQTNRTIKIIVPFPAGGLGDILARLLGERISKAQGPTVLIDNRPGAGASIGYEAAARATPDGKTLVIAANSIVINPHLKKTSFDPLTDYEAVCNLVGSPLLFVVNRASPYRTLSDLIAAARAKPGELTLASTGPATTQHIGFEQFKRVANVDITYIPYSGGPPVVNALLGAHVTTVLANYSDVVEHLKAGKLRALAIASHARIASLPEVPTVAESGYQGYDLKVWVGVLAPAKTPKDAISQLASWITSAMKTPEVESKLATLGLYPVEQCGTDFSAHIKKQFEEYGRVIRDANIKAE
jgi:tripartite-type tricarboxylate transporter receptor subunit TctC